jgi:hypothetical protein
VGDDGTAFRARTRVGHHQRGILLPAGDEAVGRSVDAGPLGEVVVAKMKHIGCPGHDGDRLGGR